MNTKLEDILKEMFTEMVERKDVSLIPKYYHPDLLIYTNNKIISYDDFLKSHIEYYSKPIKYKVSYDDDTWIENDNKIAVRTFISIANNENQSVFNIEVILIAEFKDNRIYRLWELTYPDWSKESTFRK